VARLATTNFSSTLHVRRKTLKESACPNTRNAGYTNSPAEQPRACGIGAKVVKHARYVIFQMTAASRQLGSFAAFG